MKMETGNPKDLRLRNIACFLSLLAAAAAVICSYQGIFNTSVYGNLLNNGQISQSLLLGSTAQDMLMLPVSALLFVLSVVFLRNKSDKILIVVLGLVWCEFYAFGLYVIQGQYTSYYPLYMLIFGFSIYALIVGISGFRHATEVSLPKRVRTVVGVFLLLIPLLMVPLWMMRLIPSVARNQAGDTYGVLVLDLCIVFPAICIIAVLLLRNNPLGNILAGIALIKISSLCFTWGFGEIYVAFVGQVPLPVEMIGTSGFFTIVSGVLLIPYLKCLSFANS